MSKNLEPPPNAVTKKEKTDLHDRKREMFSTNVKIYEATYKTMDGIDFRPIGRQNWWTTGKLSWQPSSRLRAFVCHQSIGSERYLCKLQIGIAALLSSPPPSPPRPCHLLMRTIASKRLGMLPVERTRNRTVDTFLRYRLPSFVPPPPRLRDDRASTFPGFATVSCPTNPSSNHFLEW